MKICYFGIYEPDCPRTRDLMAGLKENGVEIIECRVDPREKYKYWELFKKHRKVPDYDLMLVGFSGQVIMPLAKLISRKRIVFDALVSLYDANILDRKSHHRFSPQALKYWFLDWLSCALADVVIVETGESIKYFAKTFGLGKEKFRRIFIGSGDDIFYPHSRQKKNRRFLVHFHGHFIPIQGVEHIVGAAKILEDKNIRFNLIGKGPTHQTVVKLSKKLNTKNINFINFLPHETLVKYLARADVCLGFFGNVPRANRCGAVKISEALAMQKPLVTADTPSVREFLKDGKNCLLCKISDPADLAEKILELKNNPKLRKKIAQNGHRLYQERFTPKVLGKELKNILLDLNRGNRYTKRVKNCPR